MCSLDVLPISNLFCFVVLTWVHAAMGALAPQKSDTADTSKFAHERLELLKHQPFSDMQYNPHDRCTWQSSQCAALTHYSFLDSMLHNSTDKYDFKQWDFHAFEYRRWSINTILFKGSDLNNELISGDDEQSISADLPREKNRHCGAVGTALVVHLAYFPQRNDGADKLLPHFEELAQSLTGPLLPAGESSVI